MKRTIPLSGFRRLIIFLCFLLSGIALVFGVPNNPKIPRSTDQSRDTSSVIKSRQRVKIRQAPNDVNNIDILRPQLRNSNQEITRLRCKDHPGGSYNLSSYAYVTVKQIANYNLTPSFPFVYDHEGHMRTSPFMWKTSNMTYMCSYHMQKILITKLGILIHYPNQMRIRYDDPSVLGHSQPYYEPHPCYLDVQEKYYLQHFRPQEQQRLRNHPPSTYPLVVPVRMRWDDFFGHMHFQIVPLIAAVHRFHYSQWEEITWHASKYTAALLLLLHIPRHRIVIEEVVLAENVLLPWYPAWIPVGHPVFRGIASELCHLLTQNLLQMNLPSNNSNTITMPIVSVVNPLLDNSYNAVAARGGDGGSIDSLHTSLVQSEERLIVVMTRRMDQLRRVVNMPEILTAIHAALAPGYKLVVMQSTHAYQEIDQIHTLWQSYAKIVSHAKVLIGSHGSGLTNMIWTPNDCSVIEINHFPDYDNITVSPGDESIRMCIIWGHWAKSSPYATNGNNGKQGHYYNIEAAGYHKQKYYSYNVYVSIREILQTLMLIDNGALLKSGFQIEDYPVEAHRVWKETEKAIFQPQ